MTLLLCIAWPILLWGTFTHMLDARVSKHRAYFVSYQMTTDTGGTLTGCTQMKWSRKATMPEIQEFIRNACVEAVKRRGGPAPTGNVVILGVFEDPWRG